MLFLMPSMLLASSSSPAACLQAHASCICQAPMNCTHVGAHASRVATHRVLQGLEQQLVGQHVHSQLLVAEGVEAGSAAARGSAHLETCKSKTHRSSSSAWLQARAQRLPRLVPVRCQGSFSRKPAPGMHVLGAVVTWGRSGLSGRTRLVRNGADCLAHAHHQLAQLGVGGGLHEELSQGVTQLRVRATNASSVAATSSIARSGLPQRMQAAAAVFGGLAPC